MAAFQLQTLLGRSEGGGMDCEARRAKVGLATFLRRVHGARLYGRKNFSERLRDKVAKLTKQN